MRFFLAALEYGESSTLAGPQLRSAYSPRLHEFSRLVRYRHERSC